MMWSILGILAGPVCFIAGMYQTSRTLGWRALLWMLLALTGLLLALAATLQLAIPTFFTGGKGM